MALNNSNVSKAAVGGKFSEIGRRLLFVLIGIFIFRLGSHIPVPGLDPGRLADLFN
ncbi:MAG: preprotein translocase subunit SecY, partial [Gammaproteobacteria bacterium]